EDPAYRRSEEVPRDVAADLLDRIVNYDFDSGTVRRGSEGRSRLAHPRERQHEVHREDADGEQVEDPPDHRPGEADDPAERPGNVRGDFRDELFQPRGKVVVSCRGPDPVARVSRCST